MEEGVGEKPMKNSHMADKTSPHKLILKNHLQGICLPLKAGYGVKCCQKKTKKQQLQSKQTRQKEVLCLWMLALLRSSFTGLSFSQCVDSMGRGSAEDGGGGGEETKVKPRKKEGGWKKTAKDGNKCSTLRISYTILLGHSEVIQMLFHFQGLCNSIFLEEKKYAFTCCTFYDSLIINK